MSIVAEIKQSVTSGPGPLGVVFSAKDSFSTKTIKPFEDLEYYWNFDDYDSFSEQRAIGFYEGYGPIISHVFVIPKVYLGVLSVFNKTNGEFAQKLFEIEVTDADLLTQKYASAAGSALGDGSIGDPWDFATLITNITTATDTIGNLNRGDSFVITAAKTISGTGVRLRPYGTGADPIITTVTANHSAFDFSSSTNCALIEIEIDGVYPVATTGKGVFLGDGLLVYRCNIHDWDYGINATTPKNNWVVCDCNIENMGNYCVYCAPNSPNDAGTLCGVMSNYLHTVAANHLMRGAGHEMCILYNNFEETFSTCLKLVAPSAYPTNGFVTDYVYIAENIFSDDVNWLVSIGPQNASSSELMQHILVERNSFINITPANSVIGVQSRGHEFLTVRNNDFNNINNLVLLSDPTPGFSTYAHTYIFHNSYCRPDGNSAVVVASDTNIAIGIVTDLQCRNNVVSVPNSVAASNRCLDCGRVNLSEITEEYNNWYLPLSTSTNHFITADGSFTFVTWVSTAGKGLNSQMQSIDPLFVTVPSDLHLQSTSPCIAKAKPTAGCDYDIKYIFRSVDKRHVSNPAFNWDMGAYQKITPVFV